MGRAWESWLGEAERLFVGVVGVCALLSEREASPIPLASLKPSLDRGIARGLRIDEQTLSLILSLSPPSLLSLSRGEGGELCVRLGEEDELANVSKRRRKNVFAKARRKNVPQLVAKAAIEFRAAARRYAEQNASSQPPSLSGEGAGMSQPSAIADAAGTSAVSGSGVAEGDLGPLLEPWPIDKAVETSNFCDWLRSQPGYKSQLVLRSVRPAKLARRVPLSQTVLSAPMRTALTAKGIEQLYSHQDNALRAYAMGQNVMLATSTSSGKTLSYAAPAVQAVIDDAHARAFFLFPTKALAQDQLASLNALAEAAGCAHFLVSATPLTSQPARGAPFHLG